MRLRVVHITSEAVPFSKTGGLADVLGALPDAIATLGHEVTVVVPAHRVRSDDPLPGEAAGEVPALGFTAAVRRVRHGNTEVLLLDCPALYLRPAPYSAGGADYADNAMRFSFLVRAGLAAVARAGAVDVVHAHDWQAALAPLFLRHDRALRAALGAPVSVLTVHNLAYQGVFDPWVLQPCGIDERLFALEGLEFWGRVSFLKGGLVAADAVTTVSPSYAREIVTAEFGCGLEGVLGARPEPVVGILNGLDRQAWDPSCDPYLPQRFEASSLRAGKAAARAALNVETGLPASGRPLLGLVSRLVEQKGADIVTAAVDEIVGEGFDLVVLGTGERRLEEALRAAQAAHPASVRSMLRFDERVAHLIYAASDLFLMPSRFEPCGLGQMIAMRYGSLPVVHATGGLSDTVVDAAAAGGCGFVFNEATPGALVAALARAATVLADAERTLELRRRAMARDFSWDGPARAYVALYERLLAARRRE